MTGFMSEKKGQKTLHAIEKINLCKHWYENNWLSSMLSSKDVCPLELTIQIIHIFPAYLIPFLSLDCSFS